MAESRLKIKIAEHEFGAEGPADVVQSQFAAFKELVANVATNPAKPKTEPQTGPEKAASRMSDDGAVITIEAHRGRRLPPHKRGRYSGAGNLPFYDFVVPLCGP